MVKSKKTGELGYVSPARCSLHLSIRSFDRSFQALADKPADVKEEAIDRFPRFLRVVPGGVPQEFVAGLAVGKIEVEVGVEVRVAFVAALPDCADDIADLDRLAPHHVDLVEMGGSAGGPRPPGGGGARGGGGHGAGGVLSCSR